MELADRKPFFEEGVAGVQELQNEGYRSFGEEFYPGLGVADPMTIIAFSDN
jgi:hypothetical protein